jgi:glycosyltransferase involved in cell wall biosynthesis
MAGRLLGFAPPIAMTDRRTLFISNDASRSGAPMLLLHFLRWLKQQHSEMPFDVVTRSGGPLLAEFEALAPTSVLTRDHERRVWPVPERVRRDWMLSRLGAKSHGPIYSNTVTNGVEVDILSQTRRPVITHVHELDAVISLCGQENWDAVKRHTRHFIAASDAVRDNLVSRRGVDANRISVVHEFIPIPAACTPRDDLRRRLRGELDLPADAQVVIACGPTNWRKAPDIFLLLARAIVARCPDPPLYFVWVGPSLPMEMVRLHHDLQRLAIQDRVRFVGERANAHDIIGGSDVFALVSREDPFPLVCLEAAAAGVPIVCFDQAGGAVELVENDAGFVVPYLDIEAMADRVLTLVGSPELSRTFGERGARKIRERHDVAVAAPKIVEVFRKALA